MKKAGEILLFNHIKFRICRLGLKLKPILKVLLPKQGFDLLKKIKNRMMQGVIVQPHAIFRNQLDKRLEFGINIVGYTRTNIGRGQSGRGMAKAVETTGIPFAIVNIDPGSLFDNSDFSWVNKEIERPIYNTNIMVINADQLPSIYELKGPQFFKGRYNIGHWAWELPDFPNEWINSFQYLNEVWCPSNFVVDSVSQKTPIPVLRIPDTIEIDSIANVGRQFFNIPDNKYLFLSMYDIQSFQARKNPQASIDAFRKSFDKNDESVGLVIKVNNSKNNPKELELLKQSVEEYSNIYFIEETYSRDEINALLNCVDCFVSLHRSEGFGLVLAEAMYLGKSVIGTNWSGNTDFMNPGNSCAVNYELVKVGQDYGPYKAYQYWAEPDIEHASFYMKKLVNNPEWAKSIAKKGQETIKTDYSHQKVGEMIKNRLKYIGLIK